MEMLYGIVTVFRDMRFLIDGCFHLSAPKEEHKLKLSMEYVWKAAFLTMGHLYGRYPRLLVGVHSVLSGAPQAAGSRGFLSPLAASPDRPSGIAAPSFLRELLHRLCVDPLTLGPCGPQVLAARSAYYALGAQIKNYSEAGLLPAQFNQTTHMMFTSRLARGRHCHFD
jgi:hypothetical protein